MKLRRQSRLKLFRDSACSMYHQSISYSFGKACRSLDKQQVVQQKVQGFELKEIVRKLKQSIDNRLKVKERRTLKSRSVSNEVKLVYDRFGNRSPSDKLLSILHVDKVVSYKRGKISNSRTAFGSSQRLDLSNPLNFNPGPGFYDAPKDFTTLLLDRLKNPDSKGSRESLKKLSKLTRTSLERPQRGHFRQTSMLDFGS